MELCLELSLSSFCAVYIVLLRQCYVAMPSGYKLVITRALRMHGIYCTQPSCFSAICSIHPSYPCYNYNLNAFISYQRGAYSKRAFIVGSTPNSCTAAVILALSLNLKS